MTARKLTNSEKEAILHLYRTTGETSSSLATQYGVSTSTVSRILKSTLPPDEYEALIQQKRALRSAEPSVEPPAEPEPAETIAPAELVEPPAEPEPAETIGAVEPEVELPTLAAPTDSPVEEERISSKPVLRRSKRRSTAPDTDSLEPAPQVDNTDELTQSVKTVEPRFEEAEVLKEILSDTLVEPGEEPDELDDDLDDELDDDLDDLDDEEDYDDEPVSKPLLASNRLRDGATVQILPLAEATIPRTCYLVIDRSAELIAPPLREFGDLGQIPEAEVQAKTLPIFDNHRIAKRYSNPRTQRVIKLPDGRVLSKALSHLQAKGITHLLIDGRVYSLN